MNSQGFIAGIVRRPVTTIMVTIAVVLFGIVSASRLPLELLPNLSYPSITVRSEFGDAAPAEVEELVTRPIEERIGAVPGVVRVDSVSREGLSEVVLDFAWGTRVDAALAEVREKLDRVRLPDGVSPPAVLRYDPSREAIVRLALASDDPATSAAALRRSAELDIERELEKLPGVAAVEVHGGDREEIRVELDPAKLAAHGLDPQTIVDAITRDHVNIPGGAVTQGGERFLIRTLHEARRAADLEGVIVRSSGGARLRLGDVAQIRRAPVEADEHALVDGQPAVEISLYREGDANTVAVAQTISDRVQTLQSSLPGHLQLVVLSNRASFIEAAINEVISNTLIGGLFAVLVLLAFLRNMRATLVIGLAIPISLAATFVPLSVLGVSLNLMSLGGLALGVGMLVDNSIVTLESIAKYRERDPSLSPAQAAILGTKDIAGSVVASTATTVAVFFPMAFVEGIAGQLVRDLSRAISFGIISSMLVSLTVVPVLQATAGAMAPDPPSSDDPDREQRARDLQKSWVGRCFYWPARIVTRITRRRSRGSTRALLSPVQSMAQMLDGLYPALLRRLLRWRFAVVAATIALCIHGIYKAESLGRTLIPSAHQGEFFVQIELPRGTALERTHELTRGLSRALAQHPDIARNFARVGSISQAASATGHLSGPHLAELNIRLSEPVSTAQRPEDPWNASALWHSLISWVSGGGETLDVLYAARQSRIEALITERLGLGAQLGPREDGVMLTFGQPQLLSFAPPVEINILSDDLEAAAHEARALLPRLSELEALGDIQMDDVAGRPELRVRFHREALDRMARSVSDTALALARAIDGQVVGTMQSTQKALDIRVQLPRKFRDHRDDVGQVQIGVYEGTPIFLNSVAEVELGSGPAEIRRIDGRRGWTIRADVPGSDLESVATELRRQLDEYQRSRNSSTRVEFELGGQIDEMGHSLDSLLWVGLLSLFLVYVVMASSFESLMHPLLIMGTVPIAGVGVVWACAWAEIPVSIMVGIGAIILGGIVVNNAIVLTNAINHRRGSHEAEDSAPPEQRRATLEDAIVHASHLRLRPIIMTTLTTVLGLLPMALGVGEGAALRQPLAVAVIGGLALSALLTLIFMPCCYRILPGRVRDAWRDIPKD